MKSSQTLNLESTVNENFSPPFMRSQRNRIQPENRQPNDPACPQEIAVVQPSNVSSQRGIEGGSDILQVDSEGSGLHLLG